MRVLMLGWEFPPFISGGLGTACYGLTRAMSQMGIEVVFVLPRPVSSEYTTHVKLATPASLSDSVVESLSDPLSDPLSASSLLNDEAFSNVTFRTLPSALQPYQNPTSYKEYLKSKGLLAEQVDDASDEQVQLPDFFSNPNFGDSQYGDDLFQEVHRYARLATVHSRTETFDVIHAHDWMTYPAGIAVAALTGKPLVVHIHSTEFDRSGENVNQVVYDIERQGLHCAAKVIAVSHLTKRVVSSRYGVKEDKIEVVYNAIERNGRCLDIPKEASIQKDEKVVLFLGRITMQKGPEYFLAAAKKVLEVMDDVKFVMAGSGDLIGRSVELAAELGIGHKVLFTGFLRGDDVDRVFRMADLFVMPSVSEPFGLVPLEALRNDVPVIISKQSGVAEILTHVLKVDFWDIDEMANKIVAVLRHPPLQATLREHGNFEVRKLSWDQAGRKCLEIYESVMVMV